MVSGTPLAVVFDEPKLDRMSLRTIPLWPRTFGPFEPSPGNGPAVSSGMTAQSAAAAAAAARLATMTAVGASLRDVAAFVWSEVGMVLIAAALATYHREGVRAAVAKAKAAGIRVIMVTGDHVATARAIAREIGLGGDSPRIIEGAAFEPGAARGADGFDVLARAVPAKPSR